MIIDISTCDKEPIHIPGSIQSFGGLIALNSQFQILYRSTNLSEYFNCQPDFKFSDLTADFTEKVRARVQHPALLKESFRIKGKAGIDLSVKMHWDNSIYIIEIEKVTEFPLNMILEMQTLSRDIQEATSLDGVLMKVVKGVQLVTQYERVMVYKFHDDAHGEVVAEAKLEELNPFYGHHYPASDIPVQARNLFLKSFIRIIPDVSEPTVPLVSDSASFPLDLSLATLRSSSPLHIEYLQNMKVKASLTVSIIVDEKLWGLIACHQYSGPLYHGPEMRSLCELIGRLVSAEIDIRGEKELNNRRKAVSKIKQLDHENPIKDLFSKSDLILEMLEPDVTGAAAHFNGKWYTAGSCPDEKGLEEVLNYLSSEMRENFLFTHTLPAQLPGAIRFMDKACGVLSIPIKKDSKDFIMWFKPELIETIKWAGNPDKDLDVYDGRVHPRKSFEAHLEEVKGAASPWDVFQIEQASKVRTLLLDMELQKNYNELQQRNTELEDQKIKSIYNAKIASFGDIANGIAHEIQNPLAIMMSSCFVLKSLGKNGGSVEDFKPHIDVITQTSDRLSKVIKGLNFFADAQVAKPMVETKVSIILDEVHSVMMQKMDILKCHLTMKGDIEARFKCHPVGIAELLISLLNNSLDAVTSKAERWIKVDVIQDNSHLSFRISDNGAGIPSNIQDKIMDPFFTTKPAGKGAGLGLAVAQLIAGEHGGRVFLDKTQSYTTFVAEFKL